MCTLEAPEVESCDKYLNFSGVKYKLEVPIRELLVAYTWQMVLAREGMILE